MKHVISIREIVGHPESIGGARVECATADEKIKVTLSRE